jgi:hypothetical protein
VTASARDLVVERIASILLHHDPMHINYGMDDEYMPEAGTIAARLPECPDVLAVRTMIHGEFVAWFAEDLAGPVDEYDQIAVEVWEIWQQHLRLIDPT